MTTTNKFSCESWLNMDATYKGYKVEINTALSIVSIKHDGFESGSWFFQGHEADNVITEINHIYNTVSNISAIEAVIRWANTMLY
jgi:hypothetical protein